MDELKVNSLEKTNINYSGKSSLFRQARFKQVASKKDQKEIEDAAYLSQEIFSGMKFGKPFPLDLEA